MGWERRQRGGHYFYRSVRINGEPRKIYVGTGPIADSLAKQDAERKARSSAEHNAAQVERATVAGVDQAMRALTKLTKLLRNATLILSGYHEHHGEWRQRKCTNDTTVRNQATQTRAG
jgi:hypothetical protein